MSLEHSRSTKVKLGLRLLSRSTAWHSENSWHQPSWWTIEHKVREAGGFVVVLGAPVKEVEVSSGRALAGGSPL